MSLLVLLSEKLFQLIKSHHVLHHVHIIFHNYNKYHKFSNKGAGQGGKTLGDAPIIISHCTCLTPNSYSKP